MNENILAVLIGFAFMFTSIGGMLLLRWLSGKPLFSADTSWTSAAEYDRRAKYVDPGWVDRPD